MKQWRGIMDYPGLFEPCLDKFRADSFGYALLGWFRWQMMLEAVELEAIVCVGCGAVCFRNLCGPTEQIIGVGCGLVFGIDRRQWHA